MAQAHEKYSDSDNEIDSDSGSEFKSSELDLEFDSAFNNENANGNVCKRRKFSECESESRSHSHSELDSEHDSDEDEESEVCNTDKDGHIVCRARQKLGQYEYQSILGEGAFGRVLQVRNSTTGQNAALKVIKNEKAKRISAMKEIATLTKIAYRDSSEESLCLKMLNWFNYGDHICIAFPLLGNSIFDFLKGNNFEPFTMNNIRHIGHQICTAVGFLHSNGLAHTDIKPENILFVNSSYTTVFDDQENRTIRQPVCTDIRLIDFGNATRGNEFRYPVTTTTYYRAPEVILGLDWDYSYDIWAVGCTLFELYFGDLLFPTENDREHLAMMEQVLGPIPSTLANSTKKRFFNDGVLDWNWDDTKDEDRDHCVPLKEFQKHEDDNEFFDVIAQMLKYEPSNRITMSDAMEQQFFKKLPSHQHI